MVEGDSFVDFAGPLGQPSEFIHMSREELSAKRFIFIAGGLGTAPVYPQVKFLHSMGAKVDVIIGAKSKDMVIFEQEMRAICQALSIYCRWTGNGSGISSGKVSSLDGC